MNTTASTRTSDKGWLLSKFNSIFSRPTLYDSSTVGLSADIIFIIVHYLPENRDIINLAYTSKEIYASLLPIIYRSVQFETAARCNERLSFLIRNPHLARTIRKMTLRPAFLIQPTPEGLAAEQSLCRTLEILVPNLVSLETFVWEGLKMPNESIWLGLRYSCPDLKHIASSFGVQEIPEHSQVRRLVPTVHHNRNHSSALPIPDLVSFSLFSPDYQTSDYEAFVRRIQNGDPVPLKNSPLLCGICF
ncbi:hypothetical protein BD779DRAFT_1004340 [Infundibulicybe gibba]|nr:hypothetical protein BD779DRAFT_1004340 [Infundibulicybe gibba]